MKRLTCAAIALLIVYVSAGSAQAATRILVLPVDPLDRSRPGEAYIGQLLKPDTIGFKYVSNVSNKNDRPDDQAAQLEETEVPVTNLVAVRFGTITIDAKTGKPITVPPQMPGTPAEGQPADGGKGVPAAGGPTVKDFKDNGDLILLTVKPYVFYGVVNVDVKFSIQVESQDKTQDTGLPKIHTRDTLKGIFLLGQPATTSGGAAAPGRADSLSNQGAQTTYDALLERLTALNREATRLRQEHARAKHELDELTGVACPSRPACPPVPSPDLEVTISQVQQRVDALRGAYHAGQIEIGVLQTALAHIPRPQPDPSNPAPPYEAFYHKPCVSLVPDCEDFTDDDLVSKTAEKNPYGSLKERVERLHAAAFDHHFEQPAQFPIPHFGPCGERVDAEGVVIYEGMRFVATRDGQYEVSFTTSAPKMPVTLRLQLLFSNENCSFTLTLPPIPLNPESLAFDGNYAGESYQVHHAGYSPMVAENFGVLDLMTVARRGTARFGSWPEGINQFEQLNAATVSVQVSPSTETPAPSPSP